MYTILGSKETILAPGGMGISPLGKDTLGGEGLKFKEALLSPEAETENSPASILLKPVVEADHLQKVAVQEAQRLIAGEQTDLHQVILASEEASLAFQFTMQVRNKLVEAYQEIMRMQI